MTTELSPGALIGKRYRLDALLGEGGMGSVWAATHTVTRQRLALKLLKGRSSQRSEHRRRFWREARAASTVQHPNVVRIHDLFELEDLTMVMVMDLLEGKTLGALLRSKGQLSLEETATYLVPAISAVGTGHALGIIHRDLKPDNIFLVNGDGAPDVRVLDFGIAKLTGIDSAAPLTETITNTGAMLGTPYYMSPEQGLGERDVDHRTDIWSLGVILFEALAGARPVEGENLGQVIKRLMSEAIMPLEAVVPDLPPEVSLLVRRMLSRDRHLRPPDLREVQAVLERYTTARAPAFGPPSSDMNESDEKSVAGPVRVVVDPSWGDPDRATASADAPNTAEPTTSSIAPRRRSRQLVLWGALIAALGLAAWGLRATTRVSASTSAEAATGDNKPPPAATGASNAGRPPLEKPAAEPGLTPVASNPTGAVHSVATAAHANPQKKDERKPARQPATPGSRTKPVESGAESAKPPTENPQTRKNDGLVDEPPF